MEIKKHSFFYWLNQNRKPKTWPCQDAYFQLHKHAGRGLWYVRFSGVAGRRMGQYLRPMPTPARTGVWRMVAHGGGTVALADRFKAWPVRRIVLRTAAVSYQVPASHAGCGAPPLVFHFTYSTRAVELELRLIQTRIQGSDFV
jgi:hypothetical protein